MLSNSKERESIELDIKEMSICKEFRQKFNISNRKLLYTKKKGKSSLSSFLLRIDVKLQHCPLTFSMQVRVFPGSSLKAVGFNLVLLTSDERV